MSSNSDLTQKPSLKFEDLKIGMTLYQPDYHSESGIEEFILKEIFLFKTIQDRYGEEELVEVSDVSEMDYFTIGFGDGWSTSKYEKFINKDECLKYTLKELDRCISENEGMISRWQDTLNSHRKIRDNISKALNP